MSYFAGSLPLNAAYIEKVLKRSSKGNTCSIDTTRKKQNKQLQTTLHQYVFDFLVEKHKTKHRPEGERKYQSD